MASSSPTQQWRYDIFLSFRGEDTRNGFTDHLYKQLTDRGFITFRDDEKLERGKEINPELFKAIEESWCSIVVLSETYASSRWCLDELVHILAQRQLGGHKVFPVFYDVDPSDIRKQTGSVQEAFARHETRFDQDKMQNWRDALSQVADLSGWHLKDGPESIFIQGIVTTISIELRQTYSSVGDDLIGIHSRLRMLHDKICFRQDDVRVIGIWGMGGIGKTTLARVVYAQMSAYFEGECFLDDVREVSMKSGLVSLQNRLLSKIFPRENFNFPGVSDGIEDMSRRLRQKRVLLVIDDVAEAEHLNYLAKERSWFGKGSRIIITTRDEHLLQEYGVDDVYKPTPLDESEALRLFSLKAFKSDTPKNDFRSLSESVVQYAGGLPLALKVLGCFLCGRDASQWRSAIERLKSEPNEKITNCLRISFDGLSEKEKKIFLDIAHFFKGLDNDFVTKILDGCGYDPGIGLFVLTERSLITVEHNIIGMHDLLQDMGRNIVRKKSLDEPGKRCRLVEESDVHQVLTENSATETIEGIFINNSIIRDRNETLTLSADAFWKMSKLRLFIVRGCLKSSDIIYLPKELRLFEWPGYPLRSLPWNFQPDKLVALILRDSCIRQLWKGNRPLNNLKIVDLKGSQNLFRTPDFTKAKNLESLNLEGCTNLVDVNPSIALLKKLKFLNLRNCKSLRSLPTEIRMESLETFILSGCLCVRKFPEIVGKMACLREVYLDGTNIEELPSSIGNCSNLKFLDISGSHELENSPSSFLSSIYKTGCRVMSSLNSMLLMNGRPSSMAVTLTRLSSLISLKELNISGRNLCEGVLPSEICGLVSLVTLDASHNNFVSLPTNLCRLTKLEYLQLRKCKSLKSIPELPPRLLEVGIESCTSLEKVGIPTKACTGFEWERGYLTGLPLYNGVNCFKLCANGNPLRMLKAHIKAGSIGRRIFDIILPGSEMFEWFTHQCEGCFEVSEGSSYSERSKWLSPLVKFLVWVPLPPNWLNDSELMGFAFCFVLTPPSNYYDQHFFTLSLVRHDCDGQRIWYGLDLSMLSRMYGDHLWVVYVSSQDIQSMLQPCDTGFFISLQSASKGYQVKKGRARLVYRSDIEDMDPIAEQPTAPTSPNIEEIHHHAPDMLT